jgi:hypothetical protein
MSAPNYRPGEISFSPPEDRGDTNYRSPPSYAEPFPVYDGYHGGVGYAGIEMRENVRPDPTRQDSKYSTTSSLFPGQGRGYFLQKLDYADGLVATETQSFLHDPVNKIDTFYTSNAYQPYKDNTGRQLRHILIDGSSRWLITAALCGGYVLATVIWQRRPAQSEASKKMYNTITTGISIALGLNIASAFKDMALNMRWVILSNRKRSLVEVSAALLLEINI